QLCPIVAERRCTRLRDVWHLDQSAAHATRMTAMACEMIKVRDTASVSLFSCISIMLSRLRHFDEFDLAVLAAMEDLDAAFAVAEDEDFSIAELALLYRFFDGHGTHGDRVGGLHQVRFGGAGDGGELVHHDGHSRGRAGADGNLGF